VRCLWCHKDWPAGWALCPDCGSELEADLTSGAATPAYRPAGTKAFDPLATVTVRRMTPSGPLVLLGGEGRIEANVVEEGGHLACHDIDGGTLFRLEQYEPAAGALTAFSAGGEPLATYLPHGDGLDVRDGTSAPVATLRPERGSSDNFDLVETGGRRLASCWRQDLERGDCIDEQWTLVLAGVKLPLDRLGVVALPVACLVRFGRPPRPRPNAGT
jgi:hypothetical protein